MHIFDRMDNMKTVLFISPTGTFDNGAEISIFNLMCYLVEKNYQVINIVPDFGQANKSEYVQKCEQKGIIVALFPTLKWWWEEAPGGLPGTDIERAFYYRDTIGRLRGVIQSYDVDVVVTNTVNMFQGAVAAACENMPHYWLLHEFPEDEFSYYLDKIDFIDENSDGIFAVTGSLCTSLTKKFKLNHVSSFIPFTHIKSTTLKTSSTRRIVSVGRLTERKNQLELIKAYQLLEANDVALLFIGDWDDAYKEKCDTYIKENSIKGISFTGQLANPWDELTSQDICVFTSKMETFGLVYVEAILNGIPVILSDNPGHLSAFTLFNTGQLYSRGDISELVKMIQLNLLNFESLKANSLREVKNIQEKYTIGNAYVHVINAIENLETSRPKPIRHLQSLLSTNEPKSKLTRLESKIRRKLRQYLKR